MDPLPVQVCDRGKCMYPAFIKCAQKQGLYGIVTVMRQGYLVAAKPERRVVQCASPQVCAQRAWIAFLSCIEYNFPDICIFDDVFYTDVVQSR